MVLIYHLARKADWVAAEQTGAYHGGATDKRDGFIHFSTAAEIEISAGLYCKGMTDLLLIAVESASLGPVLRWENSRDGKSFPHVYGAIRREHVVSTSPLPLGADGRHEFPQLD
ncbi:MAG: DUF952 domain-containing protein [Proteobacteria bacterium]|nr:DUF952 domain-containing protein [Pseudomonadota bacterium]